MLSDRDLALLHRLEQRALGLLRSAIDFVRQDDVSEQRPLLDAELRGARVEHTCPEDVGRQHVRGELDALKLGVERAGDRRNQQRFSEARRPLQQEMAGSGRLPLLLLEGVGNASEQADEQLPDEIILADDDLADLLFDAVDDLPRLLLAVLRGRRPFEQRAASLSLRFAYRNAAASILMKAAEKK